MAKRYIITVSAANRVGILAALTTALDELSGDLREVSHAVVQRFFTMILVADFPDHREAHVILDHISDMCRPYDADVSLKDPELETLQPENGHDHERFFLTIEGNEKPGIMRQFTGRLSGEEIDITDLFATQREEGSSFIIAMELAVPTSADTDRLAASLSELAETLDVTIVFRHETDFEAANDPRPVRSAASIQTIPR